MTLLYRDEISEKDFIRYIRIAQGLSGKQAMGRDRCIDQLAKIGVKAVGPILHVVELDAMHDDETDEEYLIFNKACFEAVKRIGEPAISILEKYVVEDRVPEMVNVFAQEAIFEVLGLDEEERKKVCKHREAIPHEKNGKITFTCAICEKIITEEEWNSNFS